MKSLNEMIADIFDRCNKLVSSTFGFISEDKNSKEDACNRLRLVLMHDRSKLPPDTLEKMKDELVDVISKYVEIDKDALNLNLASEGNSIALVASIPVKRQKRHQEITDVKKEENNEVKDADKVEETPKAETTEIVEKAEEKQEEQVVCEK